MKTRVLLLLPLALALALFGAAPSPLFARGPSGGEEDPVPPVLKFAVAAAPSPLPPSGEGTLKLTLSVPTGYHIFGAEALALKAQLPAWAKAGAPVYPKGKMEEEIEVLRGSITVELPVTFAAPAGASKLEGALAVDWQGCQDAGQKVCFLPTTDEVPFSFPLKALEAQAPGTAAATPAPSGSGAVPTEAAAAPAGPGTPAGGRELGRFAGFKGPSDFTAWLEGASGRAPAQDAGGYEARFARAAKENVPLALALAFLFGLLSSLTPCVYPVIPITVAYIGSRSEGRGRGYGLFLSLAFVLGMALVYATLGAASAGFGVAFGALTQNRWVGLGVAALFLALALSMFNLFEVRTPASLTNRLERGKQAGRGRGFLGALFIGAISGLVASPCIGPLILAILVAVASTGSVFLGFLYLFVYALGLGVLFVVVGTFSGVLSTLPKSGGWMDAVRVLFGALILGGAFYFAGLYLPRKAFILSALLVLSGVALFLVFGARRHFFTVPLRVAGVLLCAAALALVFLGLPAAAEKDALWATSLDEGLSRAAAEGKPLLLDFRADWCVACVELEKNTWPDPSVRKALEGLVPVRLDMTQNTEANRELQRRFGVKGLPTVILLAPPDQPSP